MAAMSPADLPPPSLEAAAERRVPDLGGSWAVLKWLVVTAAGWFLLKELAPLLRPLMLAVFLAYIVLPVGVFIKGQSRGIRHLSLLVALGVVPLAMVILAYRDVVQLTHGIPQLHAHAQQIAGEATEYANEHIPWLTDVIARTTSAEEQGTARLQEALSSVANVTAGALVEGLATVFYLILILFEARRLPQRMRGAFADQQADQILATVGSINAAIASYLKVKVKANIVLAVPVMIALWLLGVRFVVLWGAITFLANFVPYLGSIVACGLPILFAFLDAGFGWHQVAVAAVLVAIHGSSAYLVEPAMTGKALDLSPLVVLIALSFWGLCWGLTGMILAVPLTAMLKVILQSACSTRPIALLMGGE